MNRLTLVYIAIVAASAAGLWGVLRVGQSLRAPTDLSGAWHVGGEDPKAAEQLGETVNIEQSGQFLRLAFSKGLVVDVKLKDAPNPSPQPGENLDLVFEGPAWKLAAFGVGADGPLIFRLNGPGKHTFTVTRHSTAASSEEGSNTAQATPVAAENATADAGDAATGTDAP